MDEDGLKVRYYMFNMRDNGHFHVVGECEYACYSRNECICPDGCVMITVVKILSETDDMPLSPPDDFTPLEHHIEFMRSPLHYQGNIWYVY